MTAGRQLTAGGHIEGMAIAGADGNGLGSIGLFRGVMIRRGEC